MIRSCMNTPFIVHAKLNFEQNKHKYNNKKKLLNNKLNTFFINCDITKTNKNECQLLEMEISSLYIDIENDKNIDIIDFYKTFGFEFIQFKEDIDDLH